MYLTSSVIVLVKPKNAKTWREINFFEVIQKFCIRIKIQVVKIGENRQEESGNEIIEKNTKKNYFLVNFSRFFSSRPVSSYHDRTILLIRDLLYGFRENFSRFIFLGSFDVVVFYCSTVV